jgi:hypothetical protein
MKLLEQAELVEVSYNESNKKVTLTFLDAEVGEIREVHFNKQAWDKDAQKFVDNEEKANQVAEWLEQYFGLTFETISEAIGTRHDVFCYDKFNSMFESNTKQVAKFDEDFVGQILNGEIEDIQVETEGIRIFVQHEGEVYRSNMSFSKMVGGKWYVDPQKRTKQSAKFEEKFQVAAEKGSELIGKTVMFEVKKLASNGAIYIEIKPFPKKKKK